jgi:molybdopterin-binding protein
VTLTAGDTSLIAVITRVSAEALGLERGVPVVATVKATAVHIC